MSRLVTSSPTSGSTISYPRSRSRRAHRAPHHEQFFVFGATKSIEDHRNSLRCRIGLLLDQPVDERLGKLCRRRHVLVADAGLAVDTQPDAHLALRHGEQRLIRAGQRAAVERHPERPRRRVRRLRHPDHARQVQPVLGRRARALEYREITCDTTPLRFFTLRCAGDVVRHCEVVRLDAFAAQLRDGKVEVHHVAGVVTGRQQHPGVSVRGPRNRSGLVRGRRREDVADHRTVGEPRADHAAERRVVTGSTAHHHRNLARRGLVGPHHTSRHAGHIS